MKEYDDIENSLKVTINGVLTARTKIFLDFIDGLAANDNTTRGESERLTFIKDRGKQQFMELQDELLASLKCVIVTGTCPKGIDRRVKVYDQSKTNA